MTARHKNNMTVWPEIACQRAHSGHWTRRVKVSLGGPTGYADLTSIHVEPRQFDLYVWDSDVHPVDGGPYCPAHDAVSAAIIAAGCWEPRETALALSVFDDERDLWFYDFGAQIGWFTLLSALYGPTVLAFEADAANRATMTASLDLNGVTERVVDLDYRIGPDTPDLDISDVPVALVKIDIEGAEADAIRILGPSIDAGLVEHLMIEVSPVFDDYYPDLVAELMDRGYRAFLLPPKRPIPHQVHDEHDLKPWELPRLGVKDQVAGWHQEDVWFCREDIW